MRRISIEWRHLANVNKLANADRALQRAWFVMHRTAFCLIIFWIRLDHRSVKIATTFKITDPA